MSDFLEKESTTMAPVIVNLFLQLIMADNYAHPATDPFLFLLSLSLPNTTQKKNHVEQSWKAAEKAAHLQSAT